MRVKCSPERNPALLPITFLKVNGQHYQTVISVSMLYYILSLHSW